MINYSITMRGVNTNLLEINKAKSRIKAARAAGTTPSAADTALVATEVQKAFAVAQYTDIMTIDKFAKHIADHGCVYSRADISAILCMTVECIREMLLDGKKVRLGDLGDFSLSLTSKGADNADKFTSANITGITVQWDAGSEFKNLLTDAQFNLVASRAVQAAAIKAIKAGETSINLGNGDNTDSGDSGDNTDQAGNQQAGNQQAGNTTPPASGDIVITAQAQPAAGGTVSGSGSYASGASVTLTAVPNSGYKFLRWNDGDTNAEKTVTVTESKTYNAIFSTI